MKNKLSKRILSAVLCLAMLISTLPALPVTVSAASAAGTEPVVTTDVEFHDGIDYEVTRTTCYIGNRTYSVQIDISADLSTFEHARIRTASRNGYVTIQETGYYLLELWGGDGGDGENGWTVALIPVPTEGGDGAHGGYVYGKVFLKAGQTLVYNIGTNGDQSTVHNDDGGGVNGDGGTHGDQGSFKVGGGGGYTAIYLFDEGEFDESYVTETAVNIPEAARLSRYLMIAGGGGGGGAGFTNLISNGGNGVPNGGAGGNINNGISMSLLGDDYTVPGYVFSGRNGQSSGTSTEYVGHGGSNVPGSVAETLMGYFTQSQLPNDWTGTHNPSADPGAGGSGNFRGGGGGSGYAGGSGGIMTAQLIASNVGGGGGGSSFIASEVNGQKIVFQELTADEKAYLSGSTAQPVGATTGGAIQITYLSGVEETFYQEALDNISVGATVSKYFDVLSSSKATENGVITRTDNGDGTTYVKVTGLSITPASPAHSGKTASVTLFIRAKDGFMGGNGVQLIDGVSADFMSPNDLTTPIHIVPSDLKAHKFVNVPLSTSMRTNSYTSSQKGRSYAVSSLYEDDYATARDSLTSYWEYDHISAISTYRVYQNGTQVTGSVAPTETTTYEVRYDVTPLIAPDSEVTVGSAIDSPTTITGKAVISVVEPGTAVLNGLTVTGAKDLSYADGKYTFSTSIDQESKSLTIGGQTETFNVSGSTVWTAPEDGWYYVQAWGGNGGAGGSTTLRWDYSRGDGSSTKSGTAGGSGGYVTNYVYLQQGDILDLSIGAAGSTGSTGTSAVATSTNQRFATSSGGGGGGNPTTIKFGDQTILIAGGGGGSGGSGRLGKTYQLIGKDLEVDVIDYGTAGSNSTTVNTTGTGTFTGGSGGSGSASWSQNWLGVWSRNYDGGSGGSAGVSYRNPNFGTTQNGYTLSTAAQKYASETLTKTKSGKAGQVSITMIENAEMEDVMDTVKGLNTKVAFSRYFDVTAINLDVGTSYNSKSVVDNADGSKTVTYTHSTYGQIAQFTYKVDTVADGSSIVTITDCDYTLDGEYLEDGNGGYSLYYTAHLNFSYTLAPKDGFLGGNDVPVLAYGQYAEENAGLTGGVVDKDNWPDCSVRIAQGDDYMNLRGADPTDFANVEHTVDMSEYLSVQDKTIRLGESVQKTDLYTFNPPTYSADAWQDDYATFVSPGNETYTPTQTTDYNITAGFTPRIATAQKATIVESLPAQEYSLTATVYVEVPVTTDLTNLTCDNADWTLWGESFGCTITPKSGYILPKEITVTINGEETTNYTYNDSVGTVSIEGQYVTGPIHISAKADVKTYDIHILYTMYDEASGMDVPQNEVVITGIEADDNIDWSQLDAINATIPAKKGYNYLWTYETETENGERPAKMPAHNLWVYGTYEKAHYSLTVHYVLDDGITQAAPDYTDVIAYGDGYSVISPSVKGYLPDQMVVTGTMEDGNKEITVTYEPSQNELIILYQKSTDGTLLDEYRQTTVTGETYTVNSPEFEGYETDTPVIEVTMDGSDTQTFIVKYTPKTYTVTFDYTYGGFDGASLDGNKTKLVEYDNIYGFNAESRVNEDVVAYDGLPTPQIAGYTFVGWYSDQTLTNEVKESDTVKITADTTLYAKWEAAKFKLTVRYEFLYENGDYIPEGFDSVDAVRASLTDYVIEIPYGDAYSVELPALTGYSAYENFGLNDQQKQETLSGTMPGQNKLVVISYEINTYEIKFMDLPGEHVSYSDAETSTVANDTFDTVWKTVYVKHNVVPVYEEGDTTPNHATREEYTYTFTGWYGSNDGVTYSGKTPTFPAATSERSYYAMYDAIENIISVTYGSQPTEYFTNVAEALVFAETNISSTVVLNFRRNTGNDRVLNLNDDTLVFGRTYEGTTTYTLTVDLNGLRLDNTSGQPLVENTLKPLNLVIQDSGAGGRLSVTGDGDVVAVKSSSGNLTVAEQIIVEAQAASGTACGIEVSGTSTVTPAKTVVEGKNAVGIRVTDNATITLAGAVMNMDVDGTESAMGIHITEGASLVNTVVNTNEQKISSEGVAYGIYNEGTVSSLNLKMTVEAVGNAYGLYNRAGTVTVTGIGSGTDLRASGENGYGLFNEENGFAIGAADGDKLSNGAFAGSSYGIYSADNSIFASGNFVYFKGADEATALSGVIYEGYQQTDATAQFEQGYYRLAAMRTLTFVTNGGTEIATITQLYDTPLQSVETKRSGYTFVDWHKTEALDGSYTYPATMPDEDLTLYAEWNLNQYVYALDQTFKEVTVTFHRNRSSSDTTLYGPYKLTEDSNELDPPEDLSYSEYSSSSYYLYIHSGWYTADGQYVPMYGDISDFADENGELHLYAKYNKSSSSTTYMMYSSTSFKEIGTDPNPTSVSITSSYNGSDDMYYMYYVVQVDGDYSFHLKNSGSYSVYYYVNTYKPQTTTGFYSITSVITLSSGSSTTRSYTGLKQGDVIAIAFRRYTSSTTYVSCYVTSTADLTQLEKKPCSEIETNYYNVEMGTVNLPVADNTGHEDQKFAGWAEDADSTRIMQITPNMVDTVEEWKNGELWKLYSQWDERIWNAYQSDKRDFTAFESTTDADIRGNGTVSVRFKSEVTPTEALTFKFAKGLPAGTILTLIDRSGTAPVYYTYTVTDATTELSSTVFVKMGDSSVNFSGIGTDVVLQICYQNATVTETSETVSVYAGDIVSEVDAVYGITPTISVTLPNDAASFKYTDEHTLDVEIPAIADTEYGLPEDYKVFLRVRWDGVNLAPGSEITLNGENATIYDGEYAIFDTKLTVADMTATTNATLSIYLPTMMQNEFEGKTFYYELCIAPNVDAAFGLQVESLLTITQELTLQETPSLTVDEVDKPVKVGEAVTVTVNDSDAEFYLYQQNSDGTFTCTDNCATVFESLTLADDGKLSIADGTLVNDNEFTATVSANAVRGKYYLVVKLGDKYERILLRLTANTTE